MSPADARLAAFVVTTTATTESAAETLANHAIREALKPSTSAIVARVHLDTAAYVVARERASAGDSPALLALEEKLRGLRAQLVLDGART